MPYVQRISRLLPSFFLVFLFAAGCNMFDKGGDSSTRGGGASSGFAIDVGGGAGTLGSGGDGDQECGIWLDNYGPLGVKIYRTGTADASFTLGVPTATAAFGSEPLTVAADMTIPVYDADPADNNVYFFRRGDSTLYHKIDDSNIPAVTGIRVNAGATLTLGINSDRNYSGLAESAALNLAGDLEVLGTLRSAAFDNAETQESGESIDRAGLALGISGGNVFIRPSGIVSTAGDNAATGRGGHGGGIEINCSASEAGDGGNLVNEGLIVASGGSTTDAEAEGGGSGAFGGTNYGLSLYSAARFVNTGAIRADGGTGGVGGRAGGPSGNSFYIWSYNTAENTGPVSLAGGTGTTGDGGAGGYLSFGAGGAWLHNSGAIATRGGNGTLNGGYAGGLDMYVSMAGDLLNSGAIDAGGGDSTGTDNTLSTSGGYGAQVYLWTYSGVLKSSGAIEAGGGDVANTNPGSIGGGGGYVDIESYTGESAPSGAMEISGNILARGGSGPNGGYGGAVYMYYGDSNGAGGIVLRGYSNLVNDGGAGVAYGGGGGGVYLWDSSAGGLLTEAGISANGGAADAATGNGGYGGYVDVYSNAPPSQYRGIAADGGAGANPGSAGSINIDGGGIM